VDSVGSVGTYTSLALDADGKAHISYSDFTDYDLLYASNKSGAWVGSIVDYVGDVGLYTSLALDLEEKVHISYCDYANDNLKYATNKSGTWAVETVDSYGDVGRYTSLALDAEGKAHISYHDSSNGDLKYARQVCESTDSDCDGVLNEQDNCPNNYNPSQLDTYPPLGNGIGDACDCEGNFNCAVDQDVDGSDAALFKADFGRGTILDPCTGENSCNGDFSCDGDVDGTDASLFKSDFGRSSMQNPCPACVVGGWCRY
jgi:hypothetical protein